MSSEERIRRPVLERSEPIRNWSGLYRPSDRSRREPSASPPGADDLVSNAVAAGYRVIDDHIQQGRRAAQRLREGTYGPAAATEDVQDLVTRAMRYASDMAGVWLQLVERTSPGSIESFSRSAAAGLAGGPWSAGADAAASAPHAAAQRAIEVELASRQPATVTAHLSSAACADELVLEPLAAVVPDKPPIAEVALLAGTDGRGVRVRIRIPDDQPAGTYSGLVRHRATEEPVGTVSVRLVASETRDDP